MKKQTKVNVVLPTDVKQWLENEGWELSNERGGGGFSSYLFDVYYNQKYDTYIVPNNLEEQLRYEVYCSTEEYENCAPTKISENII